MKVKITVNRITTYSSIVEMTQKEFKAIESGLHSSELKDRVEARKKCNHLIDTRDWQDDDLDSVEEFEKFKED